MTRARLVHAGKVYNGGVKTRALVPTTLSLSTAELTLLKGPSGSGTTMLLNLLGGLHFPSEGTVEVDGQSLSQLDRRGLTLFRRHNVGFGRRLRWALLVAGALWCGAQQATAASSVTELVARADHVLRGKTTAALIDMHIHTASYDRTYSMVYWDDDRTGNSRALVKILGPVRWRGHGTLKIGGRLSLYDPSMDRVTVLSSSMLGDNWMGSHFTNDDLVKETDLAKDYRPRELKHWDGTVDGKPASFHRVWLDPTPEAPVAWNHIIVECYEQGDAVISTREEYYRREKQDEATRTMTFDEVKSIGGRIAPTRLTMHVTSKPGEFTELVYKQLRFDADIPAAKFTEQELRK